MQFLCGLNDQYSHMKSNILMIDPLPVINKVFSFIVQQERQSNNANALGNLSVVNVASKSSNSCTYCGKDYHTVENCYKKNMVILLFSLLTEEEKGVKVLTEEVLEVGVITMVKCAHIVGLIDTQLMNVIENMGIHHGTSYTRLKMV